MVGFSILEMLGGLALFLYGMDTMGQGLSSLSGGRMRKLLGRLTTNKIRAVLLGTGVTAVIQSSSATTVMVVSFVDAGLMTLTQAVGVIMGANIGTTVTSWFLSLVGMEGGNRWISILTPSFFSPLLAAAGVVFLLFLKRGSKKQVGYILTGFSILMTGMDMMSSGAKPLAYNERFTGILMMCTNPVAGVAAGTMVTAAIQSSSASVGILQALCAAGTVKYKTAIPLILGQNIGTCVTALLSSMGTGTNAKRAAAAHLFFNVIGTAAFLMGFYLCQAVFSFSFMDKTANAAGIALIHSLFNITVTVLLFPFSENLERLVILAVPDKKRMCR